MFFSEKFGSDLSLIKVDLPAIQTLPTYEIERKAHTEAKGEPQAILCI